RTDADQASGCKPVEKALFECQRLFRPGQPVNSRLLLAHTEMERQKAEADAERLPEFLDLPRVSERLARENRYGAELDTMLDQPLHGHHDVAVAKPAFHIDALIAEQVERNPDALKEFLRFQEFDMFPGQHRQVGLGHVLKGVRIVKRLVLEHSN